jgi:uncharacterized protein (TIGR03066 family)
MRAILGSAISVVLVVTAFVGADDKKADFDAKKLVGKWEPTAKDLPESLKVVIEFAKEGKMTLEIESNGKKESRTGTYKFEADKLTVTIGDDKPRVSTVLKLTDDTLVFKNADDKQTTLSRLKAK